MELICIHKYRYIFL